MSVEIKFALGSPFDGANPAASLQLAAATLTSAQQMDGIKAHIDSNDTVAVVAVSAQNWATIGVGVAVTSWMKSNI